MKRLAMAAALVLAGTGLMAGEGGVTQVKAAGDVAATMDALEAAVTGAGATVFARVDHAGGADKAGMELAPSELLIFGNPQMGTAAMQDDPLAGLYLPLKVLVYRGGDGQVWLAYEEPGHMFEDLGGVAPDAGYIAKMSGALAKLTGKASGM